MTALPKSLTDNPQLATWIGFEDGGRVRLATGKVEIGQGVLTALAQIAAEELDVAPQRLRIVSGETTTSPAEGFTSGSNSIAISGTAIRLACAQVRALFLRRAADKLACAVEELSIDDGRFLRRGQTAGLDYWSIASEVDLVRPATGDAPTKPPSDYRIVGKNLPRLDLAEKLNGAAFIHDIAPANVLHVRMLRRPWPGARLMSLDATAVKRAAGAIEILREGDLVAFTGDDEVAVMRASDAARTHATWEGGTKPAADAGEPDWTMRQHARTRVVETGAFQGASGNRVVEASYSRPFLTYGSSGPSCALAQYKDGELEVFTHSQGVFELRRWLAHALGMDAARIKVFHRQGAGCYGHNSADDAAFDAAFVATRVPNRMVRVQWTRADEFTAAPMGSAMVVGLRAVLDANSRPTDWTIDIWSPVHAQRPGMNGSSNLLGAEALPNAPAPPAVINDVADDAGGGATRNGVALYDLPRHRLVHHLLPQVPVRTSSLRGLGAFANVFAIESFIDELAEIAGEDPLTYRLSLMSDERTAGDRDRGCDERMAGRLYARRPRTRFARARFGLCPLQEPRRLCRGRGRGRSRRRGPAPARVGGGRRRPGDQSGRRRKSDRGRHHPGRELDAEGAGAVRGRSRRLRQLGELQHFALLRSARGRDPLRRGAAGAGARPGRSLARPDRGGDRQRRSTRARQAHPRIAIDARAHHGDAAGGRIGCPGRSAARSSCGVMRCRPGTAAHRRSASKTRVNALVNALRRARDTQKIRRDRGRSK